MPDWRNPDDYPSPYDLTFSGWAWEFLRRNPKYIADYISWMPCLPTPLSPDDASGINKTTIDALLKMFGPRKPTIPDFPPNPPTSPKRDYLFSHGVSEPTKEVHFAARNWGLNMPCTPLKGPMRDFILWHKTLRSHDVMVLNRDHAGVTFKKTPPEVAFVSVDLRHPIEKQLGVAKGLLEGTREFLDISMERSETKAHLKTFPTYLRLLDAATAGDKQIEMASVIFKSASKVKKVSNDLRAARKRRDGGYKQLISLRD